MAVRELRVGSAEEGARLDKVLRRSAPELTRSQLQSLFEKSRVTHNGKPGKRGDAVREGDRICIELPDLWGASPDPGLRLSVVLETESYVVVNKPAHQPCAPLEPAEVGCVANALVFRYPEMSGVGYRLLEPGLVHRLDNDTSGLLLAARNAVAFDELREGLKAGRLKKAYLAIADSAPQEGHAPLSGKGRLTHFIGPDRSHSRRIRCSSDHLPGLREARCEYRLVARTDRASLFELSTRAAYRHQLRAQLAAAGYPLFGDLLYGGGVANNAGLTRHALHASRLSWPGSPATEAFSLEARLPEELQRLL